MVTGGRNNDDHWSAWFHRISILDNLDSEIHSDSIAAGISDEVTISSKILHPGIRTFSQHSLA
jgi:hypothetical protein